MASHDAGQVTAVAKTHKMVATASVTKLSEETATKAQEVYVEVTKALVNSWVTDVSIRERTKTKILNKENGESQKEGTYSVQKEAETWLPRGLERKNS